METYQVNSEVKKALQTNLFTTPEEVTKVCELGTQAIVCSNFLRQGIQLSGGMVGRPLLEFIKEYIGQYRYVSTEADCLRFFSELEDGSVDGVEFEIHALIRSYTIKKLSGIFGITTSTVLEERCYG